MSDAAHAAADVRFDGVAAAELARRWPVPQLHLHARVGSTNDLARTLAEAGAPAGTLVLADEQTAGRGRAGRGWASPPGLGIWMSLVLRPPGAADAELLPLVIGVATARALDRFLHGSPAALKWPNDLLVDGRKLGGILCESQWQADGAGFVIAGIGINVLHTRRDFPPELADRATSLLQAATRPPGRLDVLDALLGELLALPNRAAGALPEALLREIESRDALRGRELEVATGGAVVRGVALGIAADGALLLRTPAGSLRRVRSGSIVGFA